MKVSGRLAYSKVVFLFDWENTIFCVFVEIKLLLISRVDKTSQICILECLCETVINVADFFFHEKGAGTQKARTLDPIQWETLENSEPQIFRKWPWSSK